MRGRWEGIRADLLLSVSNLQAERQFKGFQEAVIDRFESPLALVAYLTSPGGDLDEKDRIYGVLVSAVQRDAAWSELATSIVWLGLWPALDAIYRRKLRHFARNPDELVSALSARFAAAVGRAELTRIRRLAATLTMNTERDVVQELRQKWKDEARRADLPDDDRLAEEREVESVFRTEGGTEAQEIAALRARLTPIVGRDVDLVLAVVLGESQRDAGTRLGLSYDVARKRYQRALDRIRASEGVVVPFPPRKTRL